MPELLTAEATRPGVRVLPGVYIATLRHFPTDTSAQAAVQALGLPWPLPVGQLVGTDPWMAWRAPQEALVFGTQKAVLDGLFSALAPGKSETAMAVELSDSLSTYELHGPNLDEWLAHLVDASSIPREPGRATRARMVDVAVFMLRLDPERLWLLADRGIAAYVTNWLTFTHEGAFGDQERTA